MAALLIRIGGIPRMTEEILLVFFFFFLGPIGEGNLNRAEIFTLESDSKCSKVGDK